MKMFKELMMDKSDPNYEESVRRVKQFEAEYGEDWESTMIEYDNDFVSLPEYVSRPKDVRTVIQWLGKGNIKNRVNAKCVEGGNLSLLNTAAVYQHYDLMSYLLLNGADVNILEATGASVLTMVCGFGEDALEAVRVLLGWGAEFFLDGKQVSQGKKPDMCYRISREGHVAIANLVSSELGGRRCEIVSASNTRVDLVGKTCAVDVYIERSDQYKVTMEFTDESLLLGADNLKRRDRTPRDPGYYVECKNNKLIRRDFKSNEECQAFIANVSLDEEEVAEVDPNAEAKAEQAAADLLAELGLEEKSCNASKNEKPPAGKKKKRGGKKKGRK